ncbi:MAG: hypothetical protein AB9873_10740 [Syntrophobacteraceae bacterium]
MLYHPSILAQLTGSVLTALLLLYASWYGVRILFRWDLRSGSELQLALERRTYFISVTMIYALGYQILSLFLFIYTADQLAGVLIGAMCAAGSLNANGWGYPTLILKLVNFILSGLWLVLNHTDNRGYDYPLIRIKYAVLVLIAPLVVLELVLQTLYFVNITPNVITSCCGTLFSSDAGGVTSGILSLPNLPVEILFYGSSAVMLLLGIRVVRSGKGVIPFAASSAVLFIAAVMALIGFASLYFYELPTHHCPFCLLQKHVHFVGYPLYLCFLVGVVSGLGGMVILPFRRRESLKALLPGIQRGLVLTALLCNGVGVTLVLLGVAFSKLSLHG